MDKFVRKSCDTVCTPGTTKREAKGIQQGIRYKETQTSVPTEMVGRVFVADNEHNTQCHEV